MGLWSKLMGGAAKAAPKPPPVRTTMGIAGHGMILAPACPCRVVPIEELLIIGRGNTGTLLTEAVIKIGTAPATEPPKRIADRVHVEPDRPSDHVYALGPSGPTITFEGVGPKLTEMFAQIDAGLALGPDSWTVLAPGFMFAIPTPGFVVCSPDPDVEGDLPSLMLAMKTSAQITFARSSRRVDMIEVMSGATALPSEEVELAGYAPPSIRCAARSCAAPRHSAAFHASGCSTIPRSSSSSASAPPSGFTRPCSRFAQRCA